MSKIIFVGGDERQARAATRIQAARALAGNGDGVVFIFPCWNRNWNKTLAQVERSLPDACALVITTDVPTLLGEALRDAARSAGVPWFSVRARGTAGIHKAIGDAELATATLCEPPARQPPAKLRARLR